MCPHCNTNNPLVIDKEWLYRCPKCGRGKLRELEVVKPLPPPKPHQIAKRPAPRTPHTATCPRCGAKFETTSNNHLAKCPECRIERRREKDRKRRARRKERRIQALPSSQDESHIKEDQ